jgi:hypothetical protein
MGLRLFNRGNCAVARAVGAGQELDRARGSAVVSTQGGS